jgi:hypothetical protein
MPIAQQCNGAVVVSVWNLIGSIALPAGGVLPTRAAPARNLASDRVVIRACMQRPRGSIVLTSSEIESSRGPRPAICVRMQTG